HSSVWRAGYTPEYETTMYNTAGTTWSSEVMPMESNDPWSHGRTVLYCITPPLQKDIRTSEHSLFGGILNRLHFGGSTSTSSSPGLHPSLFSRSHERFPPPPPPTQKTFTGGIFYGDYGPHGPEIISVSLNSASSLAVETTDEVQGWVPNFDFVGEGRGERRLSLTALKITGDPNVPSGRLTFASVDKIETFGEKDKGRFHSSCDCAFECDCWVLGDEGYAVEGCVSGYGKTAMSSPRVYTNPCWGTAKMYILRQRCEGGERERMRDGRGGTIAMMRTEEEDNHWACLLKFEGDMKTSFVLREFDIKDPPKFCK
ncbi:hypothetical protein TrRE_jg6978, partial [Triparma retinervis]